jgi:DNA-binding NtrC family response regulator
MDELVLIDDEELIVSSISRILRKTHNVTAFTNAEDALEHLRESELPDLVLCDLSMPGTSGIELYERVLAERPDVAVRFTFMSGGGSSEAETSFLQGKRDRFIQKPFNLKELRGFVARFAR